MLYCKLHLDSQAYNGHLVIKESACCPCSGGRTADSLERTGWFPGPCRKAGCSQWPAQAVTGATWWARPVGGGRREPWVQGSPHGVACVQVGEWERCQPRIQVSGERVLLAGGVGGYEQPPMPQHRTSVCKEWGRDKKNLGGQILPPKVTLSPAVFWLNCSGCL